jgi:hypothetical protein
MYMVRQDTCTWCGAGSQAFAAAENCTHRAQSPELLSAVFRRPRMQHNGLRTMTAWAQLDESPHCSSTTHRANSKFRPLSPLSKENAQRVTNLCVRAACESDEDCTNGSRDEFSASGNRCRLTDGVCVSTCPSLPQTSVLPANIRP